MNISKETWIQGLDAIKNNAYTKTHLDLSGLELSPSEMKDLLPALEANKHIQSLDLRWNPIETEGASYLAKTSHLTHLQLDHNKIGDTGITMLAKNQNFTHLSLMFNKISDKTGIILAANEKLLELNVNYNELEDVSARAFSINPTLCVLHINGNIVTDAGKAALEANKRLALPLLSKPIRRPQDNHDARFLENLQREEQKDRLRQMP